MKPDDDESLINCRSGRAPDMVVRVWRAAYLEDLPRRKPERMVVVAPPGCDHWAPPPRIDGTLIKTLARARRWRRMLEGGEHGTLAEMDRAAGAP